MFDISISGAIILSGHNGYRPFTGSIGIKASRIDCVIEGNMDPSDCRQWLDGSGKILMPGLANCHCHGDMTLARGWGDDMTLQEQNEAFASHRWFYDLIDDDDRYYARQLTYCEALLSGTTFMMENMYWGLGVQSVQAMQESGIRGALAEDIRYDFNKPQELLPSKEILAFAGACQKAGLIPCIGGISEENYEPELVRRINEIRTSCNILETCHLAETTWRMKRIEELYQTTPIRFLYQNNSLGSHLLASHVVHATDDDIQLLAKTGTKVVNTPVSEMKIVDGIAPISQMVKAGVLVCLGTDGAMWNNSNDMFREMKGMALLHTIHNGIRSLDKKEILDMGTINGARAFGLEADYGTIEAGKKADFILVETRVPHLTPLHIGAYENVTSHVIFNVTGRDVTDVFVDGRQVVKDRVLQTMDVEFVMGKVQETSDKIAQKLA